MILSRRFGWGLAVAAVAMLGWGSSPTPATPLFGIHTMADWEAALNDGRIQPVTQWNAMLESHYPGQEQQFRVPTLTAVANHEDSAGQGEDALVMEWGNGTDEGAIIAAWDYVYPTDPNLTGMVLDFSIHPPPGIGSVSVALFDANGNARGWDWNIINLVQCRWQTIRIDPSVAGNQANSTSYAGDPDFDITQVVSIQFDEQGRWSEDFPPSPTGSNLVWNAWDHVEVTPEASTVGLFGLGLLTLIGYGWRRRRSSL